MSKCEQDGFSPTFRNPVEKKIRRSDGVREGRVELPRPFGHRILRLVQLGTDLSPTSRPVSPGVVLCRSVSSRRDHAVSKVAATAGRPASFPAYSAERRSNPGLAQDPVQPPAAVKAAICRNPAAPLRLTLPARGSMLGGRRPLPAQTEVPVQ